MMNVLEKFFPAPGFLRIPAIGLDISDRYIKYVELVTTITGVVVGRYGKKPVPPEAIHNGVIQKPEIVQPILAEIQKELHIRFARVGLPEEQVYSFDLKIPRIPYEEIPSAIDFQIQEHVPLDTSQLIFDFDLITQGQQQYHLIVNAIANNTLQSYEDLLSQSKMLPLHFELEPQAIVRSLVLPTELDNFIVVDLGEMRTNISVVHHKKVIATTTTEFSGNFLTHILAGKGEADLETAEQAKRNIDLGSDSEDAKKLKKEIDKLNNTIKKYFSYWREHAPELMRLETVSQASVSDNKNISQEQIEENITEMTHNIVLCGGGANLKGLPEYMSEKLRASVQHATIWNAPSVKNVKHKIPEEEILSYATAIGLALGGFFHD